MSELQIAILGRQLMLWLNKEHITLSREDALVLYDQLGEYLEKSKTVDDNQISQTTEFQAQLYAVQQTVHKEWVDILNDVLEQANQQGAIDLAWQKGCSTLGEDAFSNVIACCWEVDEQGWGSLKTGVPQRYFVNILSLTAWAPDGHVLDLLWRSGAFDLCLLRIGEFISSERVPLPLWGRMLRLLTQEQPIASGAFWMGSNHPEAWGFERPEHPVEITRPFAAMLFPVSQLLFWSVKKESPSVFIGATRPVESISWEEALLFCNMLSEQQGYQPVYEDLDAQIPTWNEQADGYRLPTEAEWEYMAMAATDFRFSGGEQPDLVAWCSSNSEERTHGVGLKAPNALGIYDMSGNVWEWCWDGYGADYYADKGNGQDPKGVKSSLDRVCRGGGYSSEEESLRLKIRGRFSKDYRWQGLGFRLVRTLFFDQ
ncbi:MAG: hypothetical protein CMK59_04600 [Proteobacteria bacterium]|nr:hypothetical protein [Pseudomonadota bacterium]